MTHPMFKIIVRIVTVLVTAAVLVYLFVRAIVPSGILTTTTDLSGVAPFVSEPKPSGRLADPTRGADGTMRHQLINSPLYLDLIPPSTFGTIAMAVRYRNAGQRMLELGALASSLDDQFVLKPAESVLLDGLPWSRVSSGTLTLLERNKQYGSIDEFFRHQGDRTKVATYRAKVTTLPFSIPDYVAATESRTTVLSLRGSHRMLTYIKNEPLSFSFAIQDMNRVAGADPVIVSVYRDDAEEPIARSVLKDDGDTLDDQRSSPLRTVAVTLADPKEGVYKIEFTATPDVFIRELTTRQTKLLFENRLYLGDHVGYSDTTLPFTVWTNGKRVTARTAHADSVQTVTVGGAKIVVTEPNLDFSTRANGTGPIAVTTPKRDVLLSTNGIFALSPEEWFDPEPYPIEWFTTKDDLDRAGIAYILTTYDPPTVDGSVKTAVAVFDASALARTKEGAFRFVIAAPGIADTHQELQVENVRFTLRREPLSFANAWQQFAALVAPLRESSLRIISSGTSFGEAGP